jgi:hypothetical protein
MTVLEQILETFPDQDFLRMDGLDEAIIGVDARSNLLIYSLTLIQDVLMDKYEMSAVDAIEYYSFNILGAWVGERTPIICDDTMIELL